MGAYLARSVAAEARVTELLAENQRLRRQRADEEVIDLGSDEDDGPVFKRSRLAGAAETHAAATLVKVKAERDEARVERHEAQDQLQCVICFEAQRNVFFHPRRHLECCAQCALQVLGACPICRALFTSVEHIQTP